jgi:TonB family protein
MAMEAESMETRLRTRSSLAISVALHALLLVALLLVPKAMPQPEKFTEITLLDPGAAEAGAPAPAAAAPSLRAQSGVYASSDADVRFRRTDAKGQVTPVPQSAESFDDRLQSRLATLQTGATQPVQGVADAPVAGVLAGTASPATVGGMGGSGQRVDLHRGGAGDGAGPPVALTRGVGLGGTSLAPATIASRKIEAPEPAREAPSTARRVLAGAQLMGPVADRPILVHRTPVYPDWAMRDGVEGSVTLRFVVRADGSIKEDILVEKTAGFEDFDESARQALRGWKFQPLTGGRTGEQWGAITFNFRIREGG